ncbi:MAG TPA: MlaD family protein [Methylomirabilota bacterium]|jgi:phospholipid/cholesterol/gamma-HCH transport system substrate-binding protein|nr:MlaD family protein [Methylomirabilota bacterium]
MNEQQRERAMKIRVGIFVLVTLGIFLAIIYMLGARARLFEARFTIYAEFSEVAGLQEGATVRLAGVQIGRVARVELPAQPGGKVRVGMKIAKQFADRIRKDSEARIQTQGLLGDRIIEITVGTAQTAAVQPEETVRSRDPVDISNVIGEGAGVVRSVAALSESLRLVAEQFQKSRVMEDLGDTMKTTRRVAEQVGRIADRAEKGPGLAHTLLYEEPIALRRVDDLITSTQAILSRVERGEGALGVLSSEQSTRAAQRLLLAMERFGALADRPASDEGLLPALLFDPKYKSVLEDLQRVAHNFRDVSDRLAGGQGTLGGLLKDEPADGSIAKASRDLQATLENLKSITEKINEGEGTLGALIVDPTLYERLSSILDGASRSYLLRSFIRGLGKRNVDGKKDSGEASR